MRGYRITLIVITARMRKLLLNTFFDTFRLYKNILESDLNQMESFNRESAWLEKEPMADKKGGVHILPKEIKIEPANKFAPGKPTDTYI